MGQQRHETLVAWQRADDLFIAIHLLTKRFPPSERFELGGQFRRAGYSVVANIVEGVNRRSPREKLRFLNIAEASLAEAGYCLHAAKRLEYVSESDYESIERMLKGVGAPLTGLVRAGMRAVRKDHD